MSDDKRIREIMAAFGVSRDEAAFILAVERGEITGDLVIVDPETGEERRYEYKSMLGDADNGE